MNNSINKLEELTLNAWPAIKTIYHEGWVIGLSGGYTRRCNSVVPIYGDASGLEEKIVFCEDTFSSENQNSVFKITKNNPELDQLLESKGYIVSSESNVMTIDLTSRDFEAFDNITFYDYPAKEWIKAFNDFSGISSENAKWHNQIISKIAPKTYFCLIRDENCNPSGGCIGVIDNGYVGIFDLIISKDHRKKGYSYRLLSSLLEKSKENGAKNSYLLVVKDNFPALSLYQKLGYKTIYNYWYRMKQL